VTGAWIILAVLGGASWAAIAAGLKRRRAEIVRRPSYPPPVPHPPVKQAEIDQCWLTAWPTGVEDVDRFDREFALMISAEWHWPEDAR
jgi:hypothetical protein